MTECLHFESQPRSLLFVVDVENPRDLLIGVRGDVFRDSHVGRDERVGESWRDVVDERELIGGE